MMNNGSQLTCPTGDSARVFLLSGHAAFKSQSEVGIYNVRPQSVPGVDRLVFLSVPAYNPSSVQNPAEPFKTM